MKRRHAIFFEDAEWNRAVEGARRLGISAGEYLRRLLRGVVKVGISPGKVEDRNTLFLRRNALLKEIYRIREEVGNEKIQKWIDIFEGMDGGTPSDRNFPRMDRTLAQLYKEHKKRGMPLTEVAAFDEFIQLQKKGVDVEHEMSEQAQKAAKAPKAEAKPEASEESLPSDAVMRKRRRGQSVYYCWVTRTKEDGKWREQVVRSATDAEVKEWEAKREAKQADSS